ncbi:hypothetical protein PR001_g30212 [Phytophthora rubi]|uniref:JmjC domain-containing protein n=1 Tax=Phytophthora rubi TaxID=129364 RepID=A0A6A3GVB2_9STRA|nr:hypothetical protein PR001_g30212 [Phytophthora rubi]
MKKLLANLKRSQDLYRQGPFSLTAVAKQDVAVLVFCGASNDVVSYQDEALPTTTEHIRQELRLSRNERVIDYIRDTAQANIDESGSGPVDQCTLWLPGYSTRLSFEPNEAYVYPLEMWGQVGSRESAMHVDHGRTVAFIPPCLEQTFKIWVFFRDPKYARNIRAKITADSFNRMLEDPLTCVIGQHPGDVVYMGNQVYHAVLLGYKKDTKDDDKWGIIGGNVVLKAEDHGAALRLIGI